MRRLLSLKLVLAPLLAACVTVNVYFPAAAAEQAADRIIDTVTGQAPAGNLIGPGQPGAIHPPAPQTKPIGWVRTPERWLLAAVGTTLEHLIPAAQAQGTPNLDLSTPEIRAITASMQQRFTQLQKYFASGAIGLTADGMVQERDPSLVPLPERGTVKNLVAEDNRDRTTLYAEIAKANGHPDWETDIRRTFARRWVERGAQPGWYYQNSAGTWTQK